MKTTLKRVWFPNVISNIKTHRNEGNIKYMNMKISQYCFIYKYPRKYSLLVTAEWLSMMQIQGAGMEAEMGEVTLCSYGKFCVFFQ